jgi:pSer/pThr/pTyr-binding forkhead associated (FHA) protein/peroxiredoxin
MFRLRQRRKSEIASERLLGIDRLDAQSGEFLLVKPEITIGSDDINDIVIRSPTVSRRHAKLVRRQGHYELTDLDSTNGTLINSRRISTPTLVELGDEVRFGSVRFVLANLSTGGGQAGSLKETGKRRLSARVAFELALAAFFIGFGIAQYLAYLLYHEQNRLILAEAVPLPRIETTNSGAPSPSLSTPTAVRSFDVPASPIAKTPISPPESRSYKPKPPHVDELAGAMALARLFPGSGRGAGEMAPGFKLQNSNGEWVSLSSFRGKVVFLNFWATWCGACRSEMPSLEALYKNFRNEKGFAVLTVSVDQQGTETVRPFLDRTGYDFPVLLDQTNQVSSEYGVSGIPATFLIDGSGKIIWDCSGGLDWSNSEILSAIEKLLPVS